MPHEKWIFRVRHILEAIERIERYTTATTFEQFAADEKTVDAVVRNFLVIGEAARGVPADARAAHPHVPWRIMADMRNVLVHGYDHVKLEIVWDTVRHDLPPLVPLLRKILE